MSLKGKSSQNVIIYPHVVPNLYDLFISLQNTKGDIFKNVDNHQTVFVTIDFHYGIWTQFSDIY